MVKYAKEPSNPNKCCKAFGPDMRCHFKNTYEVVQAIKKDKKGKPMKVSAAIQYLNQVIEGKRCIPFRRYIGCIGRTAQAKEFKHTQGRWPVKSCKMILQLLQNAQSNAEMKNLDGDNMVIEHMMINRAPKGRRRTYRAHGRINPYMSSPSHVELILREEEHAIAKPKDNKQVIKMTKKTLARRRIRVGGPSK